MRSLEQFVTPVGQRVRNDAVLPTEHASVGGTDEAVLVPGDVQLDGGGAFAVGLGTLHPSV